MITESMRREQIIAISITQAEGVEYAHLATAERIALHKRARKALAGINCLISEAVDKETRRWEHKLAHEVKEAKRQIYADGYADGERGKYNNLHEPKVEGPQPKREKTPFWGKPWPLSA